ncbi:nucleoside triphosphate pyrophosphohydrolase [Natrinema salaciae]|uniref:Predicted house-cleaning noncanonical NTP pyrophosphatase, all-alpha NTP-PPase (MazG) superfamily n=1 Tax=Natrinema salaciae TaxID=1186196 RepID=A0A1H9MWF0_9EURY|nr:nucleoside triphosphate pyrophosphohydrolase [Natrinema salaciae]SER27901.1 Predicted house-cleaning noncanonical NTP pyrophosphatase, all-alpha NTP-PPase (MazG) superfamily [Natrinema salaciae]
MAREYDKLVRDRIPEIIERNGEVPVVRTASDDGEYEASLVEKLREEVEEYAESREREELADILEVVRAIREVEGLSDRELRELRNRKAEERGGFRERVILERVES